MKKGIWLGTFLAGLFASFIVVYAIVRLFYSQDLSTHFSKATIFEFELNANIFDVEITPGDVVVFNPSIHNTATEAMYVFIEIEIPECSEGSLYDFDIDENWNLVEHTGDYYVYAYGDGEMTVLQPGDTTPELTTNVTMKKISNAEYSEIADINLCVHGYGIDINGVSDAVSVWEECKALR